MSVDRKLHEIARLSRSTPSGLSNNTYTISDSSTRWSVVAASSDNWISHSKCISDSMDFRLNRMHHDYLVICNRSCTSHPTISVSPSDSCANAFDGGATSVHCMADDVVYRMCAARQHIRTEYTRSVTLPPANNSLPERTNTEIDKEEMRHTLSWL